jgi:hypothetical protein
MNTQDRPEGWGSRGPKPKQLKEKTIRGLEIGRGETRNIVPPEEVYKLAAIGCTNAEIAAFFDVNTDSLARNFASELTKGREYVKTRLRMNMFKAADNLQPAILIFLAKNILGMTDQPVNSEANAPLPWNESTDQGDADNEQFGETSTETDTSL